MDGKGCHRGIIRKRVCHRTSLQVYSEGTIEKNGVERDPFLRAWTLLHHRTEKDEEDRDTMG